MLISSKDVVKGKNGKKDIKNIPLYHHPNSNKEGQFYVIPRNYLDDESSFDDKVYNWKWHKNDKRKIKRIKKNKYK